MNVQIDAKLILLQIHLTTCADCKHVCSRMEQVAIQSSVTTVGHWTLASESET